MQDGPIKFNCTWKKSGPIEDSKLIKINYWRNELHKLGLVGVYPNGICFGNLSIRDQDNFIITGSGTGSVQMLTPEHFTNVTKFNFKENSLTCIGPIIASSESLTHAALYQADTQINSVIHIHNKKMWESLIDKIPTTPRNITYGTPEMAYEILRLYKETDLKDRRILVMGGHEEGIVSFGYDIDEAGDIIKKYFGKCK